MSTIEALIDISLRCRFPFPFSICIYFFFRDYTLSYVSTKFSPVSSFLDCFCLFYFSCFVDCYLVA